LARSLLIGNNLWGHFRQGFWSSLSYFDDRFNSLNWFVENESGASWLDDLSSGGRLGRDGLDLFGGGDFCGGCLEGVTSHFGGGSIGRALN
jgi:hypothetical protein